MKKTDQESFPLVVYSPNTYNSQNWTRPKPESQNSLGVIHLGSKDSGTAAIACCPQGWISRKQFEAEPGLEPRPCNMGGGLFKQPPHQGAKYPPMLFNVCKLFYFS